MRRRLYLHIGTMKSATSYLAQLCELNSDYLSNQGLLWPMSSLRYCAIRDFYGRQVREVDFTGSWRNLVAQMTEFPGDVLLCNEMLAALNVSQIKRLVRAFRDVEPHVIVTVRDLARVIPSHWQTTLKNGRTESWPDFAAAVCLERPDPVSGQAETGRQAEGGREAEVGPDAVVGSEAEVGPDAEDETVALISNTYEWFWRRHDVPEILRRWGAVVPPERTTVVTVPPPGSDPELVARRFGAVIGVDLAGLEQPEWSNPSLGAHSAELLRRLNQEMKHLTPAERSYGARGALSGSLALEWASKEPKFALSQDQQDWARSRASRMIAQIQQMGVRVVGDLADLMPDEHPPADCIDPTTTTESELLAAASHGLEGMVKMFTEVRLEKRDLAADVATATALSEQLRERVERQRKRIDSLLTEASVQRARDRSASDRVYRMLRRNPLVHRLVRVIRSDKRPRQ